MKEKLLLKIAYFLPKELIRWCVIRVWATATTGEYSRTDASGVTVFEALSRFEKAN